MAKYVAVGDSIDYTPSSEKNAGTVVVKSDLVGVTMAKIPANTLGALSIRGVWQVAKAADTVAVGDSLYWDGGAGNATTTSTANTYMGKAAAAAASSDSVVKVALNV